MDDGGNQQAATRDSGSNPDRDCRRSLLLPGRLLCGLRDLRLTSFTLLDGLYDSYGDRLTHVANGEAAEGRVVGESLDAHRFLRNHLHDGCVARLNVRRIVLEFFARSSIDLLEEFAEFAGDVRSVAVNDRGVSGVDLPRVIKNNYLTNLKEEKN